jgi:hypothetical protein
MYRNSWPLLAMATDRKLLDATATELTACGERLPGSVEGPGVQGVQASIDQLQVIV